MLYKKQHLITWIDMAYYTAIELEEMDFKRLGKKGAELYQQLFILSTTRYKVYL